VKIPCYEKWPFLRLSKMRAKPKKLRRADLVLSHVNLSNPGGVTRKGEGKWKERQKRGPRSFPALIDALGN
jgi:hypothetical protein